jgi:serine protease Do
MNASLKYAAPLWLAACFLAGAAQAQSLPDFTGLVEQASPAVVNVSATRTASAASDTSGLPPGFDEDELPESLRRFFGQPGTPRMPRDSVAAGTGFVISADGYVLTNHHVVDGADEVVLRFTDRRELEAKVVGSDPESDVALLKVDGSGFPTLKLGDSDALKPGQWVIAIGSPFGFDHSVTAGVVSATGRTTPMTGQQYVPFIQTDVAINRGNSGGPLLNTAGEVVGINSQIFSNTGGFMGVSFAIPIEVAMSAVQQLKGKGYVSRGLLGVNIQEVTRDLARSMNLPRPGGALVFGFAPDSAAKKGGLQIGDVIMSFNGIEIARSGDLPPLVGATTPGERVKLGVFRNGKTIEVPVTIGELPRDPARLAASADADAAAGNVLGLVVEDLDAQARGELGLEADEGVLIARLVGLAGSRAGLRPGDVVLMVGQTRVGSAAAFNAAVKDARPGVPVMLLVRRGEQTQFVAVTPPRTPG